MSITVVSKGIVVQGFLSAGDEESNWSVRLEAHPTIADYLSVDLYWGDKVTPTHHSVSSLAEFKRLVAAL